MKILSLKNQKQFDFVNKSGAKKHSARFIVIYTTKIPEFFLDNISFVAFGMKVSRKYSKKAVIRNKVKRRIRHVMYLLSNDDSVNMLNKSIIVIPKNGFDKANFAELYGDFKRIFNLCHR